MSFDEITRTSAQALWSHMPDQPYNWVNRASVIGQTMAPEGCGEDRTGHGGGQGGGQVGTGTGDMAGPVADGAAASGQAMTSLPAAGGAALAIAGSATPKATEAMIATTASIPRVMLAILA